MKAFQTYRSEPIGDPPVEMRLPDRVRFEDDNYVPQEDETELPPIPAHNPDTQRVEFWRPLTWRIIPLTATQLALKERERRILAGQK